MGGDPALSSPSGNIPALIFGTAASIFNDQAKPANRDSIYTSKMGTAT